MFRVLVAITLLVVPSLALVALAFA